MAKEQYIEQLKRPGGRAALSVALPNDFELYLIAIEIRDDEGIPGGVIKDFMVFPVNPDSILYVQNNIASVTKTMGGIHIDDNDTFIPRPINLRGNFGRNFKIFLNGDRAIDLKTGYGTTKYLEKMVDLSRQKNNNGKPYRTILHNLSFGSSYTVNIDDCKFNQDVNGSNMIWNYDLNVTAVAPSDLDVFQSTFSRLGLTGIFLLQKVIEVTYGAGKELLKDNTNG